MGRKPQTKTELLLNDLLAAWTTFSGGGPGATEGTLLSVLNAIQDGQDYESKLVVDDNGNGTTYLEVRIWNPDTQTWEAPLYYAAGSNTGLPLGSLVAPIIYINPNILLAQINLDTTTLATPVSGLVPTLSRATVAGANSVSAGARRVSFLNAGNNDSSVAGGTLKKGEFVSFEGGERDVLAAIPYDCLTSELVITEVR